MNESVQAYVVVLKNYHLIETSLLSTQYEFITSVMKKYFKITPYYQEALQHK